MTRQRVLIIILLVLVVVAAPILVMDNTTMRLQTQLADREAELRPLRQRVATVRQQEAEVAAFEVQLHELEGRLVGGDPFTAIHDAVTGAATQSGLKVLALQVEGAVPVEEIPAWVQYHAAVTVSGSSAGYVQFLQRLEGQRLLMEMNDPVLKMAQGSVETTVQLTFFGKAK